MLLFFCITVQIPSLAQDSLILPKQLEVDGYIKNLQSLNFDRTFKNLITLNLLHNRLNFKWKSSEHFIAVTELRTRVFWGEEVKQTPGFASLLRNEIEKINLQTTWIDNESLVAHTNVERLYLDYRKNNLNVRLGRQRINWGVTGTWNPNDIFNAYNFLDFDYEERSGVDGGKVHLDIRPLSSTEIAYSFSGKKGSVAAIRYSLNKWNYDMQLITGWYNDRLTAGLGWAGYIKDAGFKGETQYYFAAKNTASHINLTLEGDYMLKNGWYLNAGFLLNQEGLNKPVSNWEDINLKLSSENLMPTKWNFILTTAKELNPLLSANVGVLYAPGTELLILLPSFNYNMSPNLDVNLLGQSFFASLNGNMEAVNHHFFLRVKWSF